MGSKNVGGSRGLDRPLPGCLEGLQEATPVADGRRFGVILYSYAIVVYDAVKSRPQGHAREALPSLARRFVLGSGLSPARKARAPMHMVSGALASLGFRV